LSNAGIDVLQQGQKGLGIYQRLTGRKKLTGSGIFLLDRRYQYFVNSLAVHIDDLKTQVIPLKPVGH
jgi:hypothetical protein